MSQILMVLSREQLARMLGFWGSNATQYTQLLLTNTKLELNYHRRRCFQRDGTYLCPVEPTASPVAASQTLTVPSSLQLAIYLPVGAKHTQFTSPLLKETESVLIHKRRHSIQGDGTYLCPARGEPMGSPVVTSQILTVLS